MDRFWKKVEKTATCWFWRGALKKNGYGNVWYNGSWTQAHRLAFILSKGQIPDGFDVDHVKAVCSSRSCVNPDHLEAVSHKENMRRTRRSHCCRGHEQSGSNLYESPSGHRLCRPCQRERDRSRRDRGISAATRAKELLVVASREVAS